MQNSLKELAFQAASQEVVRQCLRSADGHYTSLRDIIDVVFKTIDEELPDNTAQLREALEAILLAYKKLDSEISDSDLDDKQPKHICLNLGGIRNIQKLLRKKLPNEDFFATGVNMPELPKKLPWGLRPRQG